MRVGLGVGFRVSAQAGRRRAGSLTLTLTLVAGAHELDGSVLIAAERRGVGDPAARVTRASKAERGAQHL